MKSVKASFSLKPSFHLSFSLLVKHFVKTWDNYRSSHPEMFPEKAVLKICSKFTGGHPCRSVISIKLQSNFIEITLWHGCSPVNLLHIFRTPFSRTPLDGCFWNWLLEIRTGQKYKSKIRTSSLSQKLLILIKNEILWVKSKKILRILNYESKRCHAMLKEKLIIYLIRFSHWLVAESSKLLTHLLPMHPCSTSWKHQKTLRFFDVF